MKDGWTEAHVAAAVVEWLRTSGWEVYQEVAHGPVADIVAVQEHGKTRICWIIECKTSVSLTLLDQALHWKRQAAAHFVSIATPLPRGRYPSTVLATLLHDHDIGRIEVQHAGYVYERRAAGFTRRLGEHADIRRALREEQKTHVAAGTANGGHWSDFKDTCRRVSEYVAAHPGTTLKAMLDDVDTHYSSKASARSALAHWIEKGKVERVRLERSGRALLLYPTDAPAQQLAME